jgi:RNA polymerase sigma-70 factor (ECF subfamily)
MSGTSGKKELFEAMVREYHADIRVLVSCIAPDRSAADDIAQDVFLEAYKSMDRYDPSRDAGRWLRGIARNLVRNAWRQHRRRPEGDPDLLSATLAELAQRKLAEYRETNRLDTLLEHLRRCLEKLRPGSRGVLESFYMDGYSGPEISRRTGMVLDAVHKSLQRSRELLGSCIQKQAREVEL